jgi:aryl-alcohol dehydrogenase-like predicted oxidoreductase
MHYRTLGSSNLKVSTLCLGTMMFGDQTDQAEAARIVGHAHEHGVNFIDTADVYTAGASEEMVGQLIKDKRHDWVLATKLGNTMPGRVNHGHYSRVWMVQELEQSLRRLQTDHVDIYYLHRDFAGMNLEEPLRALADMMRSGKIRYWGLSNFRGWRIAEMVHVSARLAVLQPAEPHARSRDPAGLRSPRHRCGLVQPDRARCVDGQVRARSTSRGGHTRGARRQAHGRDRVS